MLDRSRAADFSTLIAATLVCVAGAASMAGWLLRVPDVVQLDPARTPMSMNEAALLLVCGAGALAARSARARTWLLTGLGAFVIALGAATLAETLLGVDLRIDQALTEDWLDPRALHPGRMAPNSAIALALAGAALVAARRVPAAAALFGGLSAAIGATALLGYATGVEPAYGWARWRSMAPATAICLVLLGIAHWPIASARARENALAIWRGPLVAGVAAASVTLLFCQALLAREEQFFRRLVEVGARRAETELRSGIADRTAGLAILSREWEGRMWRTRGGWESDVRLLLSQSPGLIAVEWIEADGRVDWVYPPGTALPAPRTQDLAKRGDRMVLTDPLALGRRGAGIFALAPLREAGGQLDGWLSGAFDASALFADALSDLDSSFVVAIAAGEDVLFRNGVDSSARQRRLMQSRRLRFPGDLALEVRVQPSRELLAATRSALPPVLLAAGLSMSVLLTLLLGLRGLAATRARARDREARAREAAVEEVHRLNAELEARVLARTAELARSNEGLRQFASFLSHELRQPLGAQAVWADLLATKHAESLDEEARHCVSQLRSGAVRMGELLDTQLTLSVGTHAATPGEVIDLGEVAREVIADLESELSAIRAAVDVRSLPSVRGDRQQLDQLIRNLLENAIKYRSPDLPLHVQLRGAIEAGNALLTVEDNGRGFPLAEADRIFEPAVRLDPEGSPGQGLGLALCKRIAASHGGWIRARGTPGGGAVFTVLLPAAGSRGP